MTFDTIMNQLKSLGTEQNRNIYRNHGCDIDMYGVSVANLKQVLKPIKRNQELGKQFFLSSNADAIYLSQWMVDPHQLTTEEVESRVLLSHYYMLIETAIPMILAKDKELSEQYLHRWLSHSESRFRQAAYSLFSLLVSIYPNEELDLAWIERLLWNILEVIHEEDNRVRYTMNQFIISVGAAIPSLYELAFRIAQQIGVVEVSMGNTACKVPYAPDYLNKIKSMNRIGQKRKR